MKENYLFTNNLTKIQFYQNSFYSIFETIKATGCHHYRINWFIKNQLDSLLNLLEHDDFFNTPGPNDVKNDIHSLIPEELQEQQDDHDNQKQEVIDETLIDDLLKPKKIVAKKKATKKKVNTEDAKKTVNTEEKRKTLFQKAFSDLSTEDNIIFGTTAELFS